MSFFRMMFTTPATASAPYTADAPSFSTSMRAIAATGIMFTSTNCSVPRPAALPPWPNGASVTRRPLIRTSVELTPRPRSETAAEPGEEVLTRFSAKPWAPISGILRRSAPRLVWPEASISALVSTRRLAAPVDSPARKLEPVTVKASSFTALAELGAAVGV